MAGCVHPLALGLTCHRSAHRLGAALLVLGLIAALAWLCARVVAAAGTPAPVYSVAALEVQLARDPAAWLHRPVRVRAALANQCTAGRYARA
jgi:hypothetical protein